MVPEKPIRLYREEHSIVVLQTLSTTPLATHDLGWKDFGMCSAHLDIGSPPSHYRAAARLPKNVATTRATPALIAAPTTVLGPRCFL